ncbi:microtubule-actin cross-linking factor 1, isoforms 1/2/3/4/5 isoform X30 [Hetaerina americana]|uniref:microtubule-actin cross-linking factor 1, isoforms 1/2/3/4/5 isoform X30 n=1 Tax=Hetaerina americana TaxID=62018 RepID=UPI003A7F3D35
MSTQSYYKDRLGFDPNEVTDNGGLFGGRGQEGYEENLSKFKDERDAIQKKTFTKWVNKHLKKHWKYVKAYTCLHVCLESPSSACCSPTASRHVNNLFEDLRDGHNLISLLEVLSAEHLPRERGKMRFHMLQNVQIALDFLRYRKIKLVNIRAEDIVDGNPKLTLGLIWTIILHFQISDIVVGQEPNVSAREALMRWAKRSTAKYPGVAVRDFTSSWRDGLAFNALIHRNRPDLVDWRTIRTRHVRERLETAFHVVEREYGVTRLLDPEDVDTPEPDEKSLITYISSLYDVFPEPPAIHPLYDPDSQRRLEEYREVANSLHIWMREKLSVMLDRTFPLTLIEMKKAAAESARFRNEEVPPRLHDRKRLAQMFQELENYFAQIGEVDLPPELHVNAIDKNWTRLMMAHQEKDQAIQEEIKRLERLQRLAEKVHREVKQSESRLDDLERRVEEEARRLDRLHPLDAKANVDALERDMRAVEEAIQGLFNDVQSLLDGRYPQAPELHKRVTKLHQRWVNLRSLLHSRLISVLASLSFPVEERTVTRQTRTVLETRLVETNRHFRQLQECTDWVQNKLKQLQEAEYGSDLPSVTDELKSHQREHRTIEQYHSRVQQCVEAKAHFHGEELQLYVQHLGQLQKHYADLLSTSNKRLVDLESLQDFVQSATNELIWLNEREETEVTRDWSDKNIDIPSIEHYYESLMSDLEKREIQFSAVQDRGEALCLQHHPASKCIEAYINAMQSQWNWLLQLTLCLETHLRHATTYHQFYAEVKDAEQWISKRDELLNSVYSQSEFSLDEGERLLKGMQEVRDELNECGDIVQGLVEKSGEVVALKQRRQPITRPLPVIAICTYSQLKMNVEKGDQCTLHDNSQRVKWRVRNAAGEEGVVPGVCFVIPPPDKEALEAAERLRRIFDRSVALWQKKQLRLRQNMIFATIKVVKSWDLAQFLAMGQEQRNAIRKALNEDADKLLQEGDPSDPQLRRLRREMNEVNRLFDEFERKAKAEEESKSVGRSFGEQVRSLQEDLDEAERELNTRAAAPLPRDVDSLEHLVVEHKDFEMRLHTLRPRVEAAQSASRSLSTRRSSTITASQAQMERCIVKWEQIWSLSHIYVERLKAVEIVITGLEESFSLVSEYETKLATYDQMPSDIDSLQAVHEDLLRLQNSMQTQQSVIDTLNDDANNARRIVEKTRPLQRGPHQDVERMESEVHRVTSRWSSVSSQLVDRLRSCEAAYQLLQKYASSYQTETSWVDESFTKLKTITVTEEAKEVVEPVKALYNNVVEKIPAIEQVNMVGGRFIREAKIYDLRLQSYRDALEDIHPSLDGEVLLGAKRARRQPGAEVVSAELDLLNRKFQSLLDILLDILRKRDPGVQYSRESKTFRTFRTEFNITETTESESVTYSTTSHFKSHQVTTHSREAFDSGDGQQQHIGSVTKVMVGSTPEDSANERFSSTLAGNGTTVEVGGDRLGQASHAREASPIAKGSTSMQMSKYQTISRVERQDESIIGGLCSVRGIKDPLTGLVLTVGEAIARRILDVRTGQILSPASTKGSEPRRLSISEAARAGLIEQGLADALLSPSGVVMDPVSGRRISMLEAIQRELLEVEGHGEKVRQQPPITLAEAVFKGLVDPEKGEYIGENGCRIGLSDAFSQGYLSRRGSGTDQSELWGGIALSDAIERGLIHEETGKLEDLDTGEMLPLSEAICRPGVLISGVSEVVDLVNDRQITVTEALKTGLLESQGGHYRLLLPGDSKSEILSLCDAHQRQFISRPLTLRDAVDRGLVSMNGQILGPSRRHSMPLLQAIGSGILDSDSSCISDGAERMLSLTEALAEGVIMPTGQYRNASTKEVLSFSEAAEQGLLTSVARRRIFEIGAFRDPSTGDFVGLEQALSREIVDPRTGNYIAESRKLIPMNEAVKNGWVRQEVLDMLCHPVGVIGDDNKEMTAMEVVIKGQVDPWTGQVLDHASLDCNGLPRRVPNNEAIQKGLITPEGAARLRSLLNVTVTTSTVTRTIKRFVTVTSRGGGAAVTTTTQEVHMSFGEEDEESEVEPGKQSQHARDKMPIGSRVVVNLTGQVSPDSSTAYGSSTAVPSSHSTLEEFQNVVRDISSTKRVVIETKENLTKVITSETKMYELPANGWYLTEAIERNLFDAESGLFTIPGTDRLVSFEECIKLGIIDPSSVSVVIHAPSRRTASVQRCLEKHILDSTGHCLPPKGLSKDVNEDSYVTLKEALELGWVVAETRPMESNESMADTKIPTLQTRHIQVTKVSGQPDVIEVAMGPVAYPITEVIGKHSMEEVKEETEEPMEVTVSTGQMKSENMAEISLIEPSSSLAGDEDEHVGPSEGELTRGRVTTEPKFSVTIGRARSFSQSPEREPKPVILQRTRKKSVRVQDAAVAGLMDVPTAQVLEAVASPLMEAMEKGHVDGGSGSIVDPQRGDVLTISQAIDRGVLDGESGRLVVPLAHSLSLTQLVEQGLVVREGEAMAEGRKGNIVHPETGTIITLREALACDIVDPLSTIRDPSSGKSTTLQDAVAVGLVDADETLLVGEGGQMKDLMETVKNEMSQEKDREGGDVEMVTPSFLPPLGMTLSVALKRGLVDAKSAEVIHPMTGQRCSVVAAVEKDFLMTLLPCAPALGAVSLTQALMDGLIDPDAGTFRDLQTGKEIPLAEAVETGRLIVAKAGPPSPLLKVLENSPEVPRESVIVERGSKMQRKLNLLEACEAMYDEKSKGFFDPTTRKIMHLREAIESGLIDPQEKICLPNEEGCIVELSTMEAIQLGLLDPLTGRIRDPKTGIAVGPAEAVRSGILSLPKVVEEERGELMPLVDALVEKGMDPKVCTVIIPLPGGGKQRMTVEEALACRAVGAADAVEVLGPNEMLLVVEDDESRRTLVIVRRLLDPLGAEAAGFYDPKSGTFTEPFHRLVHDNAYHPDVVLVKDLRQDKESEGDGQNEFFPLGEALGKLLIDRHGGHIVDPRTGRRVPFFEAVERGWITTIQGPGFASDSSSCTLMQAVQQNIYDKDTGMVRDVNGLNESITLGEALGLRIIDPQSILVRDPDQDDMVVPLLESAVNLRRSVLLRVSVEGEMELKDAFNSGFILPAERVPVSLEAAIHTGLYDPLGDKVRDTLTGQVVNIGEAVKRRIIDPDLSFILDSGGNQISLRLALASGLVDGGNGIVLLEDGSKIPISEAIKSGLIKTGTALVPLVDAVAMGYYSPQSGLILNPSTGEYQTLEDAVTTGVIDMQEAKILDPRQDRLVEVMEAAHSGLLDLKRGCLSAPTPGTPLNVALEEGLLMTTRKPLALAEVLAHGCYDVHSGMILLPRKGGSESPVVKEEDEKVTIEDAIKAGVLSNNAASFRDPRSGEVISLGDAVLAGVVDPKSGMAIDPASGFEMKLTEARERGLVLMAKSRVSLPEAVYSGLYDPVSGTFTCPPGARPGGSIPLGRSERLPTDHAIRAGFITPSSTLVKDPSDGRLLSFGRAVEQRVVDARAGMLREGGRGVAGVDFKEALDRGLLIEVRRPMPLSDAVSKGVCDERTGLFLDPATGCRITLAQAIDENLIDGDSVHIKDSRGGLKKKMSLGEALRCGLVDGETGRVQDFSVAPPRQMTLSEAMDSGLVEDGRAPVSLQHALKSGWYDRSTGTLTDPNTGHEVSLLESIRRGVIDSRLPLYWDRGNSGRLLSLAESCRSNIIDARAGMFMEPTVGGAGDPLPLSDALSRGFIVDIEGSFGLWEVLAMGLYVAASGRFMHPSDGRHLTLHDCIKEGFVDPKLSIIRHATTGHFMKLPDAVASGLVDVHKGTYDVPGKGSISLDEARQRGLVVTARRPVSLEEAVRGGLWNPGTSRFTDPDQEGDLDIATALAIGLIDGTTCALRDPATGRLKSLGSAIQDGQVDATRGTVADPRSPGRWVPLDAAVLRRGLLVTVGRPLTLGQAVRRGSIDFERGTFRDPRSAREYTVDEAIRAGLIDPEEAVIRDATTGRFKSLRAAILEGSVDLRRRCAATPGNSQKVIFEGGTAIFLREPLSFDKAVDQGHLCTQTARFTDPRTGSVMTLKEAVDAGLIDPDSALIKDTEKHRLVRLPDAFRRGLIDPETGSVLDTASRRLASGLSGALELGLIATPGRGLALIEALQLGLCHAPTGRFTDPFLPPPTAGQQPPRRLTLIEAIESGLIEPSSTVVKDPSTGCVSALLKAMESGAVDGRRGEMQDTLAGKRIGLPTALERGYLLPAEARQAIEEKYKHCDDTIAKLLTWISEVEETIASQGTVKENVDQLKSQISALKEVREELAEHQRPVASCLDQVAQVVASGADVLSGDEVRLLEKGAKSLKSRVEHASDRSDRLLRRLESAREELNKFRNELSTFNSWLEKACRTLEEKERSLTKSLSRQGTLGVDATKDFVSDVIAHQADLRFITMAAQKFVDESKEYLTSLNEFRTGLPQRLPHVEPIVDSAVKREVSTASATYQDLLARANRLSEKTSGVGGRQREQREALERAKAWLREAEARARRLLSEAIGAEPGAISEQLERTKALWSEFVSQERLIDAAKKATVALIESLEGQLSVEERRALEEPVNELQGKYKQLTEALGDRCGQLDSALVRSQGVQDALDGLSTWLGNAENQLKSLMRPVSLSKERLEDQVREHRVLQADVDAHRAGVESVSHSAQELMATASNPRLAKKIEAKLKDVTTRYDKLVEKVIKRGEFLDEVRASLDNFSTSATRLEKWAAEAGDALSESSRNSTVDIVDGSVVSDQASLRIAQIAAAKDTQSAEFENTLRSGRSLLSKKDVTDGGPVRDRIKALEALWRELASLLEERQRLGKVRAEQMSAYERLREQVMEWLNSAERAFSHLEPVAIEVDIIKKQAEQLKPLIKEHRDYANTMDRVNDLGNAYDALLRGERPDSPARRRTSYSPAKRPSVTASPMRRPSQDARSPSPTKVGLSAVQSPMSPSGSSGFSSRRSSQDGFHLEDLTPIQQQLTEMNNRYSLLGVRLLDRQSEIDSLREEVRRLSENLRQLGNFLDRVQRQLPTGKEESSVPVTKEDADKLARQIKNVVEDMYEKQSLLDSTKGQVTDLLKRKPGVIGADSIQDELTEVVTRWKSLHDRCKERIKFMEDMKEFHDTHDGLSNWLAAKERMMTVLGPISSDSRMVQNQVQQVQVLREEFRTQQPQLKHLMEIGESLLSRVDEGGNDGRRISGKIKGIQDKWSDLLGRLEERAESLGAAADTSREFDAGLARLRDALQTISDALDDLPTDREPEETLRKVDGLERQLEGQRPLLADAEAAGEQLCRVLSDATSRSEIQGKVGRLNRQYGTLQRKMDGRKAELEASLREVKQFGESVARTLAWLAGEASGPLSERLLVSAHRDILQQQLEQHEPLYHELMSKEHEIIMLLNKGRDLLQRMSQQQRGEVRTLERDLDRIQQQWDRLKKEALDRQTRLQTCMEHCRKYHRAKDSFLPWLTDAEARLEALQTASSYQKRDLERQIKDLQAFSNEAWRHSGEYENNKTLGETFVGACDVDREVVRSELSSAKDRWDRLNKGLLETTQSLEEILRKLSQFTDSLREIQHAVQRCEDRLTSHDALGGAAKDPKLLERIRALRSEATGLRKPLSVVRQSSGDLAAQAAANGLDAGHLRDDVDELSGRLDDLVAKLDDRLSELQSAATAFTQFNDQVKTLSHDLSGLEEELDSMKPPGRDLKTVRVQIDDITKLLNKIAKTAQEVTSAAQAGEELVKSGFVPDANATREQSELLQRQLTRLDERAHSRDAELESTLQRLESFYQLHSALIEDVNDVSEQLRKLKAVGSEVEVIRSQQEEFASFREIHVDGLTHRVEECNRVGQGLVQSAAAGVSTSSLEKDLERLNEKWNSLKEKLNERDRKLDVGLLQSGKFQEALDGLSKWLADTEEMVANQKPPSADYKVVKAQMQEQKFLNKMLLDRQSSISSLFAMGNEVAANADAQERKQIERQLRELAGRYEALQDGAQRRMEALTEAMVVAKDFQDRLVPLVDWLDRTEKKVKDMELVPTDEEKIQQRIREHDALHGEILSKKPAFNGLTEVASTLMALVGEDEATMLADRLQEVADRYAALANASCGVADLLQESRAGLRHLVLSYQDLLAWMEETERRLGRHKVPPVHVEPLLRHMDSLANLTEEVAGRQSSVDSTVDSGLELMKHISGDEALQLKDKLDSLGRRFADLTARAADVLRQAQEALPLAQQFHDARRDLVAWMTNAESTLQSVDSSSGGGGGGGSGGGLLGLGAESEVCRLEEEIAEHRPLLETVCLVGPQLCQVSPGEGAATVEALVTRDSRRFEAICEQIQRRAERLRLSKLRSLEVVADVDELLEWFREVEAQIRDAEPPGSEPEVIRVQLKEHRALNDDVSSQKGRVRDVLSAAKKVLRESAQHEDAPLIRERTEELREAMDLVCKLSGERLSALEQALPLAEHLRDTHATLSSWMDDAENQIASLTTPALRPDLIAQQQDRNELFLQSINEHKPLVDKLNKTGEALMSLCGEEEAMRVQELLDADNKRYSALRGEIRARQQELERALQESSQFSDKLEGMLRALGSAAEQVSGAEPVSAHPPRIRDQMDENAALAEDLVERESAYEAVKRAADDVISKAGGRADPAINDIKRKLEKLNKLWNEVQRATNDRSRSLQDTLSVANRFWDELHGVMRTLRDLQDSLSSQEPPAVEPKAIQQQKDALQEIKLEIDQTKPEVEQVRQTGHSLMNLCGEPDKPEVKKHIEDLDSAWDNITALYAKREENLIDAMEKAMEFHETLKNLLEFLNSAEDRFARMGALGSDIDAVKKQIGQLKDFKSEVDPHMVKVEALNRSLRRQAQELTERTSADQATAIKEPLSTVNRRWDELLKRMVDRQRQLENALLRLGQFQHALQELMVWISRTDGTLDALKPVAGDPQVLEVELAKLKVLVNDIQAHQTSVDTLNDAGRQIVESEKGSADASATQERLNQLNIQWRALLGKAADRQRELEEALREAQAFSADLQDMLLWLADVDGVIAGSKPVGGLPETATEQLERFMEVYNELENNRPKVETLQQQGNEYLKKSASGAATNLQHSLRTLKQRWESVMSRANDKKIKLEIALREANEFHSALRAFVDWLTEAEKTLSNLKPVSRVLEQILAQIEEHKAFQRDVGVHREAMLNLDKKGTHLKYFSQKADVILIKNLLVSVQHRWERVVSKSAERTRALDHGYKEAKEYHDAWSSLMNWLSEAEKGLDVADAAGLGSAVPGGAAGSDPDRIKALLSKHREFQKSLAAKQPTYDAAMRSGKSLRERAPKTDEAPLKQMALELKEKWNSVCGKSVDRQRKLEEALLFSGQFKEAVQALMDWMRKVESGLIAEGPVHGDLDTVMALVEHHKAFEEDLESRSVQMDSVRRTGRELQAKASPSDSAAIESQLKELDDLWRRIGELGRKKTLRLEEALKEAERLHKAVHMLLEWLSDAEMKLRFAGPLPEDDQETRNQLAEHEKFMREMAEKEVEKDSTIALARSILEKAHPDGITVIKHWITIIQSRWEEVSTWAKQREHRLRDHLGSLRDLDSLLEELLAWVAGLEGTLVALEAEPLPDDQKVLESLIDDHKEFMENAAKRTPDVDRVCKSRQVKAAQVPPSATAAANAPRKLSKPKTSTSSRVSPGREKFPESLPHIGPRFSPKGSKGSEPQFRSPRVKQLWDGWRNMWMMAWERQRRLHDRMTYLEELEKVRNFSWDDWRKRFLKFMNHKKSRLTDLFRKMDKNNDNLIPREDFIDGIMKTKFLTSKLEMNAVSDLFDRNSEGYIDWKEFIAALRPDWEENKPKTEADKIHDEVKRLVMLCTCRQKFRVLQVGEGQYRFGESQKLRLVRILRSTVMVRVGGGWVALDEFLVKNDPCRVYLLPIPDPNKPEEHEPWCPLGPIEKLRRGHLHLDFGRMYSSPSLSSHLHSHLLSHPPPSLHTPPIHLAVIPPTLPRFFASAKIVLCFLGVEYI